MKLAAIVILTAIALLFAAAAVQELILGREQEKYVALAGAMAIAIGGCTLILAGAP